MTAVQQILVISALWLAGGVFVGGAFIALDNDEPQAIPLIALPSALLIVLAWCVINGAIA